MRSRARGPRVAVPAIFAVSILLALAACSPTTPPSAPASSAGPTLGASADLPVLSPPVTAAPPSSAAVALAEPALLDVLPDTSDVFSLTYDPETTATVASDPGLDPQVAALAIGLYRMVNAAPDAPDFAIVNVVRLRDPSLDAAWFQSWRETYDEAACGPAGGVVRRAQTPVRGLTVYVGSCAAGPFTYHVRLEPGSTVVSMTSVGPGRIGQSVVERLAP